MKKITKKLLALGMVIGMTVSGLPFSASAAISGVDPLIDPTVNKGATLPDGYDQGLKDGLPYGVFVVEDKADYSFGIATDSKGNLYTAAYGSGVITKRSPDCFGYVSLLSKTTTISTGTGGVFGLTVDSEDALIYTVCLDSGGYVVRRDKTGKKTTVMSDLVRPNGVATDKANNIYVACENGTVQKWNRATGAVTTLATALDSFQGIAVDGQGVVYALSYGRFSDTPLIGVGYSGGSLYQFNTDGSVEKVLSGDSQYIWRARGVCVDENGYVYLTGEANAWDNGNSSLIARYDPKTRTVTPVQSGLDYATFIASGTDGRLYTPCARDDFVAAYSKKAAGEFSLQSGWEAVAGSRVITHGGTYLKNDTGNLSVKVGSKTFKGTVATAGDSNKVSGWIHIPADALPEVSKVQHDSTGAMLGMYDLPGVSATASKGTVKTFVTLLREHRRSRWPMVDLYHAATDYSEAPEAYLVYFEWTPKNILTYQDTATEHNLYKDTTVSRTAPAYNSTALGVLDFSGSSADVGYNVETDTFTAVMNGTSATTPVRGNGFRVAFKTENCGDWLGFALDNNGASGLGTGGGLRGVLFQDGTAEIRLTDETEKQPWDFVTSENRFSATLPKPLNDGEYHTLEWRVEDGKYALLVDNKTVASGFSAAQTEKINKLCGGAASYLTFFTATGSGTLQIKNATGSSARFFGWTADAQNTGVYTSKNVSDTVYVTFPAAEGFSFEFRHTNKSGWLHFALGSEDAVFPQGDGFYYDFNHGKGLKVLLQDGGNVEERLLTDVGWNNYAWKNTLFGVGNGNFNNGAWHTAQVKKENGVWQLTVDGTDLLADLPENLYSTLQEQFDSDKIVLLVGVNGNNGTAQFRRTVSRDTPPVEEAPPFSVNSAWEYNAESGIYLSQDVSGVAAFSGNFTKGMSFSFRHKNKSGWLHFAIGTKESLLLETDPLCYDFNRGTGLKLLLKDGGDAEARLITQSGGWDTAKAYAVNVPDIAANGFNDGAWHTVRITKHTGVWQLSVDGKEILQNLTAAQNTTLDGLFGAAQTAFLLGCNGNHGTAEIKAEPFSYTAQDLVWLKSCLLDTLSGYTDINSDGKTDVRDLVRMKKNIINCGG